MVTCQIVPRVGGADSLTGTRCPYAHSICTWSPDMMPRLAVAACWTLGLVGLGPQVHALSLLAWPQVAGTRLVERQLLGDGREQLLHVLARLRRSLEEEQTGLAGILLGVGGLYGALVGRLGDEIELVAGEGDDDVFVGLALELLDPRLGLI
jgi:hypothetical protein